MIQTLLELFIFLVLSLGVYSLSLIDNLHIRNYRLPLRSRGGTVRIVLSPSLGAL